MFFIKVEMGFCYIECGYSLLDGEVCCSVIGWSWFVGSYFLVCEWVGIGRVGL